VERKKKKKVKNQQDIARKRETELSDSSSLERGKNS